MSNNFYLSFLLFLIFAPSLLAQETIEVKGTVIDLENGFPIPSANIIEKGTSNGVLTDFDGNFEIQVPISATLEISYLGYEMQEIEVKGSSPLEISLSPGTSNLDEVIIVAYGTQARENITGSVSKVSTQQLVDRPVTSTQDALQGISPGVTVLQRPGDVGSVSQITIRGRSNLGSSGPMYIIDGIPASAQEFATLNSKVMF